MMQVVTNNVSIATAKIQEALKTHAEPNLQVGSGTTQTLDLAKLSIEFRRALMATDLTRNQRAQIAATLGDKTKILDEVVCTPGQLEKLLKTLVDPNDLPIEVQIAGRWYPFPVNQVEHRQDQHHGNWCSMQTAGKIVDRDSQHYWTWSNDDFRDPDTREQVKKTVRQLLDAEGIRLSTPESLEAYRERAAKAERLSKENGRVLSITGPALQHNKWLYRGSLDSLPLGTKDKPRQVIVETELEREGHASYGYGHRAEAHQLPFLRIFSLDLKRYVYVDVDDVQEYTFDTRATDRLVLPQDMKEILDQIFETSTSEIFGDLFAGRHGGMVVLANGPQGVGKSLTAECFAQHTKRPLYILEMGELGTDLKQVEESLQRVFARAARWNAVLLFDEADVFLAKREEADLERSAIVGVFLRLLDRYEGMFFLTSNRAKVIDPAFASRITLNLEYPQLDGPARQKVWQSMLDSAGFKVTGDMSKVYEAPLDGRQIRNQVRLLKVTCKEPTITATRVESVLKYARILDKKAD